MKNNVLKCLFVSMIAASTAFAARGPEFRRDTADTKNQGYETVGATLVEDRVSGSLCVVDQDTYAVRAPRIQRAPLSMVSFNESRNRVSAEIPTCSQDVSEVAAFHSQFATLNGQQQQALAPLLIGVQLVLGLGSYHVACSLNDAESTINGEFYRNNTGEHRPDRVRDESALVGAKIVSVVGGVLAYTVCLPSTMLNFGIYHVFIK